MYTYDGVTKSRGRTALTPVHRYTRWIMANHGVGSPRCSVVSKFEPRVGFALSFDGARVAFAVTFRRHSARRHG